MLLAPRRSVDPAKDGVSAIRNTSPNHRIAAKTDAKTDARRIFLILFNLI
jgi:hypothetical protein